MRSRRVLLLSKMGGSFWGQQFSFSRLKIKKVFKVILSALLILAVASSFLFIMVINYLQLEVMGQMGNFKGASIFFASFLAFLIPFIFSLLGAGGTIFRGKELLLLMPLPIDPTELYASRVLRHYKHNIYFYLLFFLPGLGVHYYFNGFSLAPLLLGAVGSLLPIVLSATISQLIFLSLKRGKRRLRGEIFATFFLMIIILGIQGVANRFTTGSLDKSSLEALGSSFSLVMGRASKWLFPVEWVRRSALKGGFGYAILALLSSLALSGVALYVGNRTFVKVAQKALEGEGIVPKRRKREVKRGFPLLKKELAVIHSNSAFILELYGEAFIPFILIFVYFLTGTLKEFATLFGSLGGMQQLPLIISGILLLLGGFSLMSSTSVSREGRQIELMRTLPIETERHLKAKVIVHLLYFFSTNIIYSLAAIFMFKINFAHLLWMLPLSFISITTDSLIGLAIDFRRPRSNWQTPQQAVKQNMNGLIGMGISFGVLLLYVGVALLFSLLLGASVVETALVVILVALVALVVSYKLALSGAQECYGGKGIRTPDLLIANQSL
jgi:ABC-2 type transport system permease protein